MQDDTRIISGYARENERAAEASLRPQVLEELRKEEKTAKIPVVFLTGRADRTSVMSVMRLMPQGYLLKSTTKEELIALLEYFFANRRWKNV